MGEPVVKDDRIYRYQDYKGWPDEERWELIDGVAYNMSPAPSTGHQTIVTQLVSAIHTFQGKGGCRVFTAPFDVLLPESPDQPDDEVSNVVQPDLAIICDPSKLKPFGCVGAPDWLIDPGNRFVHVYVLGSDGRYPKPALHVGAATVKSTVCPGFELRLEELFAAIPG